MMPCDTPTPGPADAIAPALITTWRNLQDTAGESIDTSWEQFFATLEDPQRYRGDLTHPGWSACHCEPAVRAASNVVGLSALVLDYDTGTKVEDAAALWSEHFGIIHTSRKHTASVHRFRVILPFARIVTPEEYAIVWRWAQRLASSAGQKIDAATKDVARFWYLPAATDAYETRRLGGKPIDPDPLVAAHKYDENERTRAAQQHADAPRGDVEKRAAKYLAKLPQSISGSGGHLALWTAALSLVRGFRIPPPRALQMLKSDFNPRCQPPWSDRELVHKVEDAEQDATTAYGYLADRVRDVTPRKTPEPPPDPDADFTPEVPADMVDMDDPAPAPASTAPRVAAVDNWRAMLSTSPQGHIKNTFDNICRILEHHEAYGERLAYDEMRVTPTLNGRHLTDADVGRIRRELEQHFGFQPNEANVRAAIGVVADARRFHPVRRYLSGLKWDREERINRVVPDVLHATNTTLHQSIVRKWFIAAAKRALEPGCQVDTLLVLVGDQGVRKSTFFRILGGEWFSDTFMDITNKDAMLQLHAAWIYEWGEIERVTTERQASIVKAFSSSTSDNFRAPFGRTTEPHQRTTVIVGSTNADQFLVDPTGSRRFHIVSVGKGQKLNIEWLTENRDQLWAEATEAAREGERAYLDDDEEKARALVNEDFQVEDAWSQPIGEWLAAPPPTVTSHALLTKAVGLQAGQINRAAEQRVGSVMRRLGWERRKVRQGERTFWTWRRVSQP